MRLEGRREGDALTLIVYLAISRKTTATIHSQACEPLGAALSKLGARDYLDPTKHLEMDDADDDASKTE